MKRKIANMLWWFIEWLTYLYDVLTDLGNEPQIKAGMYHDPDIEAEMHHVHDIDDMW